MGFTSKSMHREVQIKHDLMTRKCIWITDSDQLEVAVVTQGKNDINTVSFLTQTARFMS